MSMNIIKHCETAKKGVGTAIIVLNGALVVLEAIAKAAAKK